MERFWCRSTDEGISKVITILAIVALSCCAFMAKGDRTLRESDEYWARVEWEEKNKERLKNHGN